MNFYPKKYIEKESIIVSKIQHRISNYCYKPTNTATEFQITLIYPYKSSVLFYRTAFLCFSNDC